MASELPLSTAQSGGHEVRHSPSLLDVLNPNQFQGDSLDAHLCQQTEENFYRGAPPTWLNFYISEQLESDGQGTPFVKRDGYSKLVEQICERKRPRMSTVKLYHQTGCGGTTLAMQVLWDMRKTFRCAVLSGSSSDITKIAKEVVHLFTAGGQGHQKTVLLLLNDEQILENLQDNIMMEIAEQTIVTRVSVVIFFTCIRKNVVLQNDHVVLEAALSDTEKQKFNEKKEELHRRFSSEQCEQFHGFNILQTNFSQEYVKQACKVICPVPRSNRSKRIQLVGFLSLLNAYVPGSYLLENQCLDLFKHEDYRFGDLPLEDRMKPFRNLIITFQQDPRSENRVRMAHPMIAQCCTELMAEAGVTRSDTARNFLTHLCRDDVPPFLLGFVKDMLTKREMKMKENPINSTEITEEPERFSRLILDIQKKESETESASVLKVASEKFDQNPFFPQALARFYYLELKDYNQAELWAKRAKQRDPQNSFIADTLGQVHKNHLKNTESPIKTREILQLATKAINAFKDEERLAENEQGTDMKEDGKTNVSSIFNTRGQAGYLQVCNLVYDRLVNQNETWKGVLTKVVPIKSVLELPRDNQSDDDLIKSLRDEVAKKCAFFDKYLSYSKPDMNKDDPSYLYEDIAECYRKYVRNSPPEHVKEKGADFIQKLEQNVVDTSAGPLSCLDGEYSKSELKEIITQWEDFSLRKDSVTALVNYIFAHVMLMNRGEVLPHECKSLTAFRKKMPLSTDESPESHMLALLLYWPTDDEDKCASVCQLIECMRLSYKQAYEKYLGSRHLCPLFFIGKAQGLNRIVHRKTLEELFERNDDTIQDWSNNWSSEKIFKDPTVQDRLLKVDGVVRNYRLYATVGGTKIRVDANMRNRLWKPRQVSFYLGFTIRGPVAFGIQTKTAQRAEDSQTESKLHNITTEPAVRMKFGASCRKIDSSDLTKLQPEVIKVDDVNTFSLQSDAGQYECSVSALRWVCKDKVSFTYQFRSWEEHMRRSLCKGYMQAGPLLDISVTSGNIEELHLPHWICIDRNVTVSDMFAVLHVDASDSVVGNVVEPVPVVTTSHIMFSQPTFSPKGIMIRKKPGIPIYCDVLIYKRIKEFLTLDVYLVPRDPALKQEVEQNSCGSVIISKPGPDKSLQMGANFLLTTDQADVIIQPSTRELRYDSRNVFEVFIRNADSDFTLRLESEQQTVWTCTIQKGSRGGWSLSQLT
ncbi:sterile alpha motif domain-containing protein 9-like isoform X3 [Acanthopagrus latus]|uniref:sterile alpha motif domain-containing protein 9-like isoform X3 n=1 Tax=Acanthopagrus latus TaxID=8177 RepID=UPI00187BDAB0|nr:sterile alpha motif domain-containing protein 9-like isoform X3 [Acanthopagrus latus]